MSIDNLNEEEKRFLTALWDAVGKDPAGKASMYDVGAAVGMDRDAASHAAQELMGWNFAEVRTLSGDIGVTAEGAAAMDSAGRGKPAEGGGVALGNDPVPDQNVQEGIEELAAKLKAGAAQSGLDYERLSELMADIRTLDAQISSPRPKTSIIRECFRSIQKVLEKTDAADLAARVAAVLKES